MLIGSQSTGQGHATSYAQLVAERLDLPPERVRVVQGDTDAIATGAGTGGSSSIPVGGVSVDRASKTLAEQLKQLAADALEAAPTDMEIADGAVRVAGTDRVISFADLAARPEAKPEQLRASSEFGVEQPTFPNGTHIAEVEIDPDTGATAIVSYVVVDDFGATLNPLLLAGQVHGGAVQGIGQALMEDTVYDAASGQLLSASFMDYAMPRAADAPDFVFETRNVPCKNNPLGVKGAGEAGAIGSCPALINAILDALWRAYQNPPHRHAGDAAKGLGRDRGGTKSQIYLNSLDDHEFVITARNGGLSRPNPQRMRGNNQVSARVPVEAVLRTTESEFRCSFVLILAVLAIGFGLGTVMAQQDPVKTREDLMKKNNDHAIAVVKMMRGQQPFDAAAVDAAFKQWADTAQILPSLFPENSKTGGDNRASPKIWVNKKDFDEKAAAFGKARDGKPRQGEILARRPQSRHPGGRQGLRRLPQGIPPLQAVSSVHVDG